MPYEDFKLLIEYISKDYYSNITLLGYKNFGFGEGKIKHNYPDDWIKFVYEINKNQYTKIGIDSVMVKNWRTKLIEFGVSDYLLVGTEGKSTCFIDTVKQKVFSSSFSHEKGHSLPKSFYDDKSCSFLESFSKL